MPTIQEKMEAIKSYLQGMIKPEMEVNTITSINDQIKMCDEVIEDSKKTQDELVQAKEVIIKVVKNSGSSDTPKDDSNPVSKTPRSLEEIAKEISNKKE
ncbi:MAG: hypothetical protein J6S85_24760 [Methanobrevibacter sp.]|nr:hypothetical protein [Methanobrevibacter sp.]